MTERTATPVAGTAMEHTEVRGYVSLSYRYLRIGMITLVLLLFVAVGIQRLKDGFLLSSISQYYYTPAQLIFVGALISIGVCLVVLKGSSEPEDALLNYAGILAPVVALVPTPQEGDCLAPSGQVDTLTDAVANNLLAYLFVGSIAMACVLVAGVVALVTEDAPPLRYLGAIPPLLALCVAWYFYLEDPEFVMICGHPISAFTMFGFIVVVVLVNSLKPKKSESGETWLTLQLRPGVGLVYLSLGGAMVVLGGVIILTRHLEFWEGNWVFWLEAIEIFLFAVFWIIQTLFDQEKTRQLPATDNAERMKTAAGT